MWLNFAGQIPLFQTCGYNSNLFHQGSTWSINAMYIISHPGRRLFRWWSITLTELIQDDLIDSLIFMVSFFHCLQAGRELINVVHGQNFGDTRQLGSQAYWRTIVRHCCSQCLSVRQYWYLGNFTSHDETVQHYECVFGQSCKFSDRPNMV